MKDLLSRSDSRAIDSGACAELLAHFGISQPKLLDRGSEAAVYEIDEKKILKVYADVSRLGKLQMLAEFYGRLDASRVSFSLPQIYEIHQAHDLLGVLERRISGSNFTTLFGAVPQEQLFSVYVRAISELANIRITQTPDRYMLFDEAGISSTAGQTWSKFFAGLLERKVEKVGHLIKQDVAVFHDQVSELLELVSRDPGPAALSVLHGDFYPGNIMMDSPQKIAGVIDFGTFTMFGDHLFDVATAWGFYDMYGPARAQVRSELLRVILEHYGEAARAKLFTYLLSYAVLSCDLYAVNEDPRSTGHYQWAMEILKEETYWEGLH